MNDPPATTATGTLASMAKGPTEGANISTGNIPPAGTAGPPPSAHTANILTGDSPPTGMAGPPPSAHMAPTTTARPPCSDPATSTHGASPGSYGRAGTPPRPGFPTPWSNSFWFPSGNCIQTVTPGDARPSNARPSHNRVLPDYRSCPPPLMTETSGVLKLGGPIVSPRASDRERLARDLKISRYDIALLATAN